MSCGRAAGPSEVDHVVLAKASRVEPGHLREPPGEAGHVGALSARGAEDDAGMRCSGGDRRSADHDEVPSIGRYEATPLADRPVELLTIRQRSEEHTSELQSREN